VWGVGYSDNCRAFDGFEGDHHHVAVVTLHGQRIAGNDVVLYDEMHSSNFSQARMFCFFENPFSNADATINPVSRSHPPKTLAGNVAVLDVVRSWF
jgi:hypothetical protein